MNSSRSDDGARENAAESQLSMDHSRGGGEGTVGDAGAAMAERATDRRGERRPLPAPTSLSTSAPLAPSNLTDPILAKEPRATERDRTTEGDGGSV